MESTPKLGAYYITGTENFENPLLAFLIPKRLLQYHRYGWLPDLSQTRQAKLLKKVDAYLFIVQLKYQKLQRAVLNVPLDSNYAKQAIRPFTIGRKNFALMESDHELLPWSDRVQAECPSRYKKS